MLVRSSVIAAVFHCCALPLFAQDVTFESLLEEMVDRESIASFPAPYFTCRQASSYDRDSVSKDKQSTWYANWDRSQFVRVEKQDGKKHYVLMDEEGPGAIVRFWSTWHGPKGAQFSNGTLSFYLDGSNIPAIQGPIADILSGHRLVGAPLSEGVSPLTEAQRQGHNLYLPIPYGKHCRITYTTDVLVDQGAKQGEALYYQINYRKYAEGTRVETLSKDILATFASKLESTRQILERRDRPRGEKVISLVDREAPRDRSIAIKGSRVIERITIKPDFEGIDERTRAQQLRSTILSIEFDGELCVWCPVGDFFGGGYRASPFKSWYAEVEADGTMSCSWAMPFERSCTFSLTSLIDPPLKIASGEIEHSSWQWNDRSMHFHAAWNEFCKLDTRGNKSMDGVGAFDVNYVALQGTGVFAGDTLTVFNGTDAWWGEGDEKIYVDGESFPSHFGTGTEDYYGYAWCRPERFDSAFHAQPSGEGNLTIGYTVNSRYRSLDTIPFKQDFRFDMEMWHWRGTTVNYAPTVFWYARPESKCNLKPNPESARQPIALAMDDIVEVRRVPGAIEGEKMKIVSRSAGVTEIQEVHRFGWSSARQLWWRDASPGSTLELSFDAPSSGRFEVLANLTQAVDYGVVKFNINDTDIDTSFDRYIPVGVKSSQVSLGTLNIDQGENRLTVTIAGANKNAQQRHMFGLDYILLEPAD